MQVVPKWGTTWKTSNLQIENVNCVNYFSGIFSVVVLSTCITGSSPF